MIQTELVTAFKIKFQSFHTHSSPIANRHTILILFLVGIRRFQTALAGSTRMTMSETMLNKQVTRTFVLLSRHFGSSISGFQIASRGEQAKMVKKVLIM